MHICFDWDGTLVKKDVAEEASMRRGKTLGAVMDRNYIQEAMKTHAHYKVNKELISKYTGIKDERQLTTIIIEIFRFHYLGVVNEWKQRVFYPEVVEMLKRLKEQGHSLSIASTLRQDILDFSLEVLGMRDIFSSVKANTPDLQFSKEYLVGQVMKESGKIQWMIGDREEDALAGKKHRAKTIFVAWGAEDKKENIADFIVSKPTEILACIR